MSMDVSAHVSDGTTTISAQNFGGPDAVENVIEEDTQIRSAVMEERLSQQGFDWKQQVQEEQGFSISLDYTPLYLQSSEDSASGEGNAASGILRVFGSWDLTGRGTRNTGALVWKIENRHSYTDVSPQDFGFDQRYVGLIEAPFSDEGSRLTNLYGRQRFNEGHSTVTAGMLDVTDYVDVYALASPGPGAGILPRKKATAWLPQLSQVVAMTIF